MVKWMKMKIKNQKRLKINSLLTRKKMKQLNLMTLRLKIKRNNKMAPRMIKMLRNLKNKMRKKKGI